MNMPVKLPSGWRLADEANKTELQTEWQQWRDSYSEIALTADEELQRELRKTHPLHGADCRLVAWDSVSGKEFLFSTPSKKAPLVMVHFTWQVHSSPFMLIYSSLEDFAQRMSHLPESDNG